MNVEELEGAELDAAVAKAEGVDVYADALDGDIWHGNRTYRPSSDWARGGPIIARERISITYPEIDPALGYEWHANIATAPASWNAYGASPLIAAMRAYVASKL